MATVDRKAQILLGLLALSLLAYGPAAAVEVSPDGDPLNPAFAAYLESGL